MKIIAHLYSTIIIKKFNAIQYIQFFYFYIIISAINCDNNNKKSEINSIDKIWHTILKKNYQKRYLKIYENKKHYRVQQETTHKFYQKYNKFLQQQHQLQTINYFTTQSFFKRNFFLNQKLYKKKCYF